MIWLLFATKSTDLHIHIELGKVLICDTTLHWHAYHFLSHLQSEKGGTEETDICCSDANFALSAITKKVEYLPHTCGLPLRRDICHKDILRNNLILIIHLHLKRQGVFYSNSPRMQHSNLIHLNINKKSYWY